MPTLPSASPQAPDIQVRAMVEADLSEVIRLQAQCYEPAFHEPVEAFEAKWQASPDTCWVVTQGPLVYAYLVSIPVLGANIPALHATTCAAAGQQADWLYLHDMAISPLARGRGLSQLLLDALTNHVRSAGLTRIGLIAVQQSAEFWRKHGFEIATGAHAVSSDKLASFGKGAVFMLRQTD